MSNSRRVATLVLAALAAALGLGVAGVLPDGAGSAVQPGGLSDTTPSTTPSPTVPEPDPAPPVAKPKPKPKPLPRPATHSTPRGTPYVPPHVVHIAPATPAHATHAKPKVVHRKPRPKPKKVVHRTPPKRPVIKPKPTVVAPIKVGAESPRSQSSTVKADGKSALVIGMLGISMMVFALVALPARAVRWQNVGVILLRRQIPLTLLGLLLMAGAGVAYYLSRH